MIVHSAPDPSPLIGTLVYSAPPDGPIPSPLSVTSTIFIDPSTELSLTAASSVLVLQSVGTGI